MFKDNPAYNLQHTEGKYNFYTPVNITDYHKSRENEATIQNIYSNAGATAEYIGQLCEAGMKMIENDQKNDNLRQNMISILNELIYRTKYPVDSLCAIRMGAILTFMEFDDQSEPLQASFPWIERKVSLALDHPDLYAFFLSLGMHNTEAYLHRLESLQTEDYFQQRQARIQSFSHSATK